MGTIADALYERSKSDDKLRGWPGIVGSEIRAAIGEVEAERDAEREKVRMLQEMLGEIAREGGWWGVHQIRNYAREVLAQMKET